MLGDKQEQSAEGGSTAIQAGGNVHFHQGLTVAEVREMCSLFLRDNFPKLREEAQRVAEEHVRSFAANFEEKLVREASQTDFTRFSQPDVQAAINDAVNATARKGNSAHIDILTSLILDRVSKRTNDYKETVLSEAVTVVPKLTSQQIALISFVHAASSMAFKALPTLSAFEPFAQIFFRMSTPGFNLSDSQRRHIEYAGACSVSVLQFEGYKVFRENHPILGFSDDAVFKQTVAQQAPTLGRLLDEFDRQKVSHIRLTSVGQAIAIAHISSFLGKIDYTVWLQ